MTPPDSRTADPGLLRLLPSVDALLRDDAFGALPPRLVARVTRETLDQLRQVLLGRGDDGMSNGTALQDARALALDPDALRAHLVYACEAALRPRHRRVLNATGIVLHTGIGRAPLSEAAKRAIGDAAGSAIVEVDPTTGLRNQREEAVAELLCALCGTEAALVVNNNAAAVNVLLRALAEGREVIVSRGELVEIGGGFRMPDVMSMAGCHMVEVGATNRTHLRDFEGAITEQTAMLMKVHTSNYRIEGFAGVPPLAELAELGKEHEVPVVEDLGSGLLVQDALPGLEGEPRVHDSLAADPDLICFSGDKLLGGPQCGILVGRKDLVRTIRAHALYRAFRCDKLTLAALEATLRIHRDGEPLREIPALRMLSADVRELRMRAEQLAKRLEPLGAKVVESESYVGSGANPARALPCFATALPGGSKTADRLRAAEPVAVFSRVADGQTLLESRSLLCEDLDEVANAVRAALD